MEYFTSIFVLGLMVSLLVAKGIFAAQNFAQDELMRQDLEKVVTKVPDAIGPSSDVG